MSIRFLITSIALYQKTISPDHGFFYFLYGARHCRFFPSCSDYAMQALRQYGLGIGIMLSLKRIGRCHPFSAGGYDPVQKK